MKQPLQPIYTDDSGVVRFQGNALVRYLLDNGGIDLNQLAVIDFPQEDREQFAQLIGYSLGGFGGLSYVRDETYEAAAAIAEQPELSEQAAHVQYLERLVEAARKAVKELAPELFRIHPDDLHT